MKNGSLITLLLIFMTIDINLILPFTSHLILEPCRPKFNTSSSQSGNPEVQETGDTSAKIDELFVNEEHQMRHRHLFRSYFYQYHLIQMCSIIIAMVRFFLLVLTVLY